MCTVKIVKTYQIRISVTFLPIENPSKHANHNKSLHDQRLIEELILRIIQDYFLSAAPFMQTYENKNSIIQKIISVCMWAYLLFDEFPV